MTKKLEKRCTIPEGPNCIFYREGGICFIAERFKLETDQDKHCQDYCLIQHLEDKLPTNRPLERYREL
jgi:hypothetical protein